MKKILFVVDEKMLGGVSIVLENILWSLDLEKYKVDVAVLHNRGECLVNIPKNINVIVGGPFFDSVDFPLSEIIKSKNIKLLFNKLRLVLYLKSGLIRKKIMKERKKMNLDNYDCEIAFKDGFTALFTAYGNTSNKIHWLHYEYNLLNPNEKYNNLFKEALPKFNKIVAVSKGVMDCFNKIYHLENKTIVIANLINTDAIIKKAGTSKEENNSGLFNFISVGRLHEQKGYDHLLNVINKLNLDNKLPSDFHLEIYGDGPKRDELLEMNKKYKLESRVEFKGQVMNPFQFIKNANLFILSSIYEPFGLVIVEAMTLGVPVLATANAATSELINNGQNGMIVENSEDGLCKGLLEIFNNPNKLNEMKLELVNYKYENSNIMQKIESLF